MSTTLKRRTPTTQATGPSKDDTAKQAQAANDDGVVVHPIQTGIPPWHSFVFLAFLVSITIPFLPSWEELDEMSALGVWTHRTFPHLVSLEALAAIRLGIAAVALGLTFYLACIHEGWDVYPNYKPRSLLRREFIRLQGIGTMAPFTSWCWLIYGLGFLTRGILVLAVLAHQQSAHRADNTVLEAYILENKYLLRLTLVLWELTGPLAMLVSAVVKYVIWPQVAAGGKPHNLAGFRNQLQHNCNAIGSLLEVTFLGGMKISFSHLSMPTLLGVVYILFTWIMATKHFGNKTIGPQYIYWFMDTTLGETTTKALAALAFALALFFGIFSVAVQHFLHGGAHGDSSPATNLLFLVVGTRLVCKFKN